MQIQPQPLETLLKLRREYITSIGCVCERRQQLLHQLQSAPQLLGNDSREIGSHLCFMEEITEQLQQCVTQEDELLFEFSGTVSLTVSRQGASSSLTGMTLPCTHLTLQLSFACDMFEVTERQQIMACLRTRQASHVMVIR